MEKQEVITAEEAKEKESKQLMELMQTVAVPLLEAHRETVKAETDRLDMQLKAASKESIRELLLWVFTLSLGAIGVGAFMFIGKFDFAEKLIILLVGFAWGFGAGRRARR